MIDVPILVKDALKEGTYKKNYRFNVLNDDGTTDFTIDNDSLVAESVSIDERMCSGDTIKFGLCEGSSLEFQYFNHPNITKRKIEAFIDVEYMNENNELQWYEIPMGFFDVKDSARQSSTGIIKVTAYNKLQSDYLDSNMAEKIKSYVEEGGENTPNQIALNILLKEMLKGYSIETNYKTVNTPIEFQFGGGVVDNIRVYENDGEVQEYLHYYYAHARIPLDINSIYKIEIDLEKLGNYYLERYGHIYNDLQARNEQHNADPRYVSLLDAYLNGILMYGDVSAIFPSVTIVTTDSEQNNLYEAFWAIPNGGKKVIEGITRCKELRIKLVAIIVDDIPGEHNWTNSEESVRSLMAAEINGLGMLNVEKVDSKIGEQIITPNILDNITELSIRDLQSATFEIDCRFGCLDRKTDLFTGYELNNARLLPQTSLYPGNNTLLKGAHISAYKNMYSQLWADEGNIQSWKFLIITYKGLDNEGNEKDYTLQRTINANGTQNYNMSDNWLFRNLVWTSEQIGEFADAMVEKMRGVTWFPFEMWCAGLPYVETGDEIEVVVGEETYTSYVLQRQLKGIQNLQDTYINGTLDIF